MVNDRRILDVGNPRRSDKMTAVFFLNLRDRPRMQRLSRPAMPRSLDLILYSLDKSSTFAAPRAASTGIDGVAEVVFQNF